MKERRAGSSLLGFGFGLAIAVYGFATVFGYDALAHLSSGWLIGGTAICFGSLLLLWAVSQKWNIVGGETVSMIVGVLVALVVISSFVHETERDRTADQAAAKVAHEKR